ncbi:MAG: hypothetical protein ACOX7J_03670 [Bacillota bacterium]
MQDKEDKRTEEKVFETENLKNNKDVTLEPVIDSEEVYDAAVNSKGGWKWWIFTAVFGIALMLIILAATSEQPVDEPETVAADVVKTEDEIYKATYVERNLEYRDCGHTVTDILHGDERFVGKTFSQLEGEGWNISKTGSNKVRIYREVRGLCDADSSKRTLRLTEKGIGIYEGPKSAEGRLLNEMELDTELLPEDMKKNLEDGGMEFGSEEELMETLDSLDEYVNSEYESYYSGIV